MTPHPRSGYLTRRHSYGNSPAALLCYISLLVGELSTTWLRDRLCKFKEKYSRRHRIGADWRVLSACGTTAAHAQPRCGMCTRYRSCQRRKKQPSQMGRSRPSIAKRLRLRHQYCRTPRCGPPLQWRRKRKSLRSTDGDLRTGAGDISRRSSDVFLEAGRACIHWC
jgi:hypothetical protein